MAEVQTPTELARRLFAKPPSLQNLSLDSSPLLNSPVESLEEGVVRDLLAAELCTTTSDQQQFNDHVSTGSLLHLLAFVGRNEAAEWLLKNGAFVHSLNHARSTPLHVAAVRHHAEMIRTLRYYHADPYCENEEGKTALDLGQDGDDVKEALLSHRFSGEEVEDEFLQDRLPQLVERVTTPRNHDDLLQSVLCLRAEIRTSTSSMTSVPKPLKFLGDKFDLLKEAHEKMPESPGLPRALLSDILSVLAITVEDKQNLCLKYRLSGSGESISSFGHPYISRICTQMPGVWQETSDCEATLLPLVHSIVVYCLDHSSESEAADLLMEIDHVALLKDLVKEDTYQRVCLYLTSCVKYVPEPEDAVLLHTALDIYRHFQQYPHALRLALMLNDVKLVRSLFLACPDRLVRKQLAFMLGRQQVFLELEEQNEDIEEKNEGGEERNEEGEERSEGADKAEEMEQNGVEDAEDLTEIMSNVHLNNNFLALARELDIMEPKVPEDIYKTHLEHVRFSTAGQVDSSQGNLASSFVNGFVNCGFGMDKLLTEDGNKWIYKNKGVGMLSATASLGLVLLWDVEGGLTEIDKFLYSNEESIKAGALLACGIVNCGVRNECDPALALLSDYTQHKANALRCSSLVGMGLAYAGSAREDVLGAISPGIWDEVAGPEVISLASLSSGLVAVGTGHGELTETLVQAMHEKEPSDLSSTWYRFLALGLALVHLGKQEEASLTKEALNVVAEPLRTFAITLLDVCAYTGTGSVLKIQEMLHVCSEYHKSEEEEGDGGKDGEGEGEGEGGKVGGKTEAKAAAKPDEAKDKSDGSKAEAGSLFEPGSHQALAVLGIALIAMGEDIGAEMAHRIYSQLLHYGEPVIRRAVPLALALLSTSHPQLPIIDTLHKFSHDSDPTVARNAIFSMGLVGSGTNNARLAGMLRNLAQFYHKEPSDLFMVRLAQGLTHLGKGTLTLNPYHSDRMLISPVAVAALLIVMVTMLDASNIILKDAHYMLFYLTPAIQPRMLVTFDEDLNPLQVTVRVGQAVDIVGQAGKPKTITGFQTHKTPVLLAYGERAELATEEYIPLTPILEGFVILKKNLDYEQ